MISNGLLDQAVANARHNVELLHEWSRQGGRIIACEPSCILTIKDDYPALLKGELRSKAQEVAEICGTLEELIGETQDREAGPRLRCKPGPRRILVQSHCHQRSLIGVGPMLAMLRAIPDAEVIDLDAGCCGMAGSFGYESEHYEVSRLVGENRLLPAVRRADPDDRHRRTGVLVPAPDPAFHRPFAGPSRRAAAILSGMMGLLKPGPGELPPAICRFSCWNEPGYSLAWKPRQAVSSFHG